MDIVRHNEGKDGALLRELQQLSHLLQNDAIVKQIPKYPWTASSRKWAQSTIKHLEDDLLSRALSVRKISKEKINDEDCNRFEVSVMERKSELEAIESKIIELQVGEEILSKRFTTCASHSIPSNVDQLSSTFRALQRQLTHLVEPKNNVASDGTFVKIELGMEKVQEGETSCRSKNLWSQPDVLTNFNLVQSRELYALAKYCQCILQEGFVTDSSLNSKHIADGRCSTTGDCSLQSCMESWCNSTKTEAPIGLADGNSLEYYSELHTLNEMYGKLQLRKIKQMTASGALSAALKQMRRDCHSFSISTDQLCDGDDDDDARSATPMSARANRDVVDFPSTMHLRSEILRGKETIESVKKDIGKQIEELKTTTEAVSSARTFSFDRVNTELKRHKLFNLLQQQEKVINVLKSMKKRRVDVEKMLEEEKNMLGGARLHAQNAVKEFNRIKQSLSHLQLAFDELQFQKTKRKPFTVHPDDRLSRFVHDILLQDEMTLKNVSEPIEQMVPSVNVKNEFVNVSGVGVNDSREASDASHDFKQCFRNVFAGNDTITCDKIINRVTDLDQEIFRMNSQLDAALRKKRSEVVEQYEMVQNSQSVAISPKHQMTRDSEGRLEMKRCLKRLEMGLAEHMDQWCRHRQQIGSDSFSKKEDEAFVDFFTHPNRAALNIKRWKSEQL